MTPREPDRYEAQAGELAYQYVKAELAPDFVRVIAAALRAEHASALERAALWFMECGLPKDMAESIAWDLRALIPPAAVQESQRDTPCGACGHPLWWHQWGSKEHAFCCAPLDDLQRDYCQCRNYEKPAAAPAPPKDPPAP